MISRFASVALLLLVWSVPASASQTMRTFNAEHPLSASEPPLRATLEFGAGKVWLKAGEGASLYKMRLNYDAERYAPIQRFDHRTGILHLGLRTTGGAGIRVTSRNHLEQAAKFEFAPSVPLYLEANLGSSDAVLDLGGLSLRELAIRSGASRGKVNFSVATKGICSKATFSVGASELIASNLSNAGCALVRVEGGVGRAVLNFGGKWRSDTRTVVDLSMGTLTLEIPRGTGVQVSADRFLTKLNINGLEKTGTGWATPGFSKATHKLTLELQTMVAGIEVVWIK